MKAKILVYTVIAIFIVILQAIVFEYLKLFGIKPNLFIVFIVAVGLIGSNWEGTIIGFSYGLLQDIVSGKMIGFYALLGCYLGLALRLVNRRLYRENILVVIFFTFISTIIYELIVFISAIYIKSHNNFAFAVQYIVLPEAVYNSVLSFFVYLLINKLNRWFDDMLRFNRKY